MASKQKVRAKKKSSRKKSAKRAAKARATGSKAAGRTSRSSVAARPRALPAPAREAANPGVEALRSKLEALKKAEAELRDRRTNTAKDEEDINPTIASLRASQRRTEAAITAASAGTLPPPTAAQLSALQSAVRNVEDLIAKSASVNRLIEAATTLIKTLQ